MAHNNKINQAARRLVSLDAYRGLVIAGMISGGLGMRHLIDEPVLGHLAGQFLHTDWQGLTFYDLIFPSFLFIVGVAMPFSYAKNIASGRSYKSILRHTIQRAIILFLLGSLRISVKDSSPTLFELSSALQPIACAYFVSFLLLQTSIKLRAVLSGIIIALYWLILSSISVPDIPAGTLEKDHNIVWYVDTVVLGRAYGMGWGTLLLFFPQIVNTLAGTIVGDLLRSERQPYRIIQILAITGCTCIIGGLLLDQFIPIIMKIWTPSYVVCTVGWSCILMLLFYWLIDVRGYKKWAFPLVVFGMNAIALYMGNSLFGGQVAKIVNVFLNDITGSMGQAGPTFNFIVILSVKWLIFYWMYNRRIFIKV